MRRQRDPDNRCVQHVELTEAGDALFLALREQVAAFDQRLRHDLSQRDLSQLRRLLDRLASNAADPTVAGSTATS